MTLKFLITNFIFPGKLINNLIIIAAVVKELFLRLFIAQKR